MTARTLLMLGGADIQVTAIQRAKELGYRVVTCDYLPGNPGHRFADEYHNVSTTDKEAVLAIAKACNIDGISAYASDPAAVTAAYVSEQLGLPGDPFRAVTAIQDKVRFREVQSALGIPSPEALEATELEQVVAAAARWPHGGIIKPVDTSGSKGIHRITPGLSRSEVERLFQDAIGFSRAKRVVLEEYLPRSSRQMTGDALIVDGRIVFHCFGDVHFNDRVNGLVPRGVTLPGSIAEAKVQEAMDGLQRVIDHLGLRQGVYNIDLFLDERQRPIVVDIGARNGGNMLNTLYLARTGVDLMDLSLRLCMGETIHWERTEPRERFVGHNVVHSTRTGILRSLRLSERIEPYVFYRSFNVQPGDRVGRFINSGHRLGLLLLEFPNRAEMEDIYANIYDHVVLDVEPVTESASA